MPEGEELDRDGMHISVPVNDSPWPKEGMSVHVAMYLDEVVRECVVVSS